MTTLVWLLVVFVVVPAVFITFLNVAHHGRECACGRLGNPDNPDLMCDRCLHYASSEGYCPACERDPHHLEMEQ